MHDSAHPSIHASIHLSIHPPICPSTQRDHQLEKMSTPADEGLMKKTEMELAADEKKKQEKTVVAIKKDQDTSGKKVRYSHAPN